MARSTPSWEALQREMTGEVALPGSPAYEELPRPFNARYHHVRPQAVVLCSGPQDVAETISFARRYGLENAMRSGGHSFAGYSSTPGIIIDVTPMGSVSVSGGVATVGAGARLGGVYEALEDHGLTIPAGTCPPVGAVGLTLGGGLGILGRRYGVTSDHLIRAQIVMADGRLIECDETHDQDLFWALRGAGAGNFGVVTSLVFRAIPAPAVTNFHLAWTRSYAGAVIDAWQEWAPVGPDELAASLKVTASGAIEQEPSVDVYGALLGTESDATALADELVVRVRSDPTSASREQMSFPETRRFWAELGGAEGVAGEAPRPQQPYLFSKSEFFRRRLPTGAIGSLVKTFSLGRPPGESRELDFMPWGGGVQPRASRRHRLRSSRGEGGRTSMGCAILGVGASVGVGARVPELRRPRPRGVGGGLLRDELRALGEGQGKIRPGRLLPLPSVGAGPLAFPRHLRGGSEQDDRGAIVPLRDSHFTPESRVCGGSPRFARARASRAQQQPRGGARSQSRGADRRGAERETPRARGRRRPPAWRQRQSRDRRLREAAAAGGGRRPRHLRCRSTAGTSPARPAVCRDVGGGLRERGGDGGRTRRLRSGVLARAGRAPARNRRRGARTLHLFDEGLRRDDPA